VDGRHVQDLTWVRPDGEEMTEEEWGLGWVRCLGLKLSGRTLDHVDTLGQPVIDKTFLILLNPHWEPIDFYMPKMHGEKAWRLCLDTRVARKVDDDFLIEAGQPFTLIPRSLAVFTEVED
jgi:glycogen operon protein